MRGKKNCELGGKIISKIKALNDYNNKAAMGMDLAVQLGAQALAAGIGAAKDIIVDQKRNTNLNLSEDINPYAEYGTRLASKDFQYYDGPKHENGGIMIDSMGKLGGNDVEVEGGETRYKNYIFSDKLMDLENMNNTYAKSSKELIKKYKNSIYNLDEKASLGMEMNRLKSLNDFSREFVQNNKILSNKKAELGAILSAINTVVPEVASATAVANEATTALSTEPSAAISTETSAAKVVPTQQVAKEAVTGQEQATMNSTTPKVGDISPADKMVDFVKKNSGKVIGPLIGATADLFKPASNYAATNKMAQFGGGINDMMDVNQEDYYSPYNDNMQPIPTLPIKPLKTRDIVLNMNRPAAPIQQTAAPQEAPITTTNETVDDVTSNTTSRRRNRRVRNNVNNTEITSDVTTTQPVTSAQPVANTQPITSVPATPMTEPSVSIEDVEPIDYNIDPTVTANIPLEQLQVVQENVPPTIDPYKEKLRQAASAASRGDFETAEVLSAQADQLKIKAAPAVDKNTQRERELDLEQGYAQNSPVVKGVPNISEAQRRREAELQAQEDFGTESLRPTGPITPGSPAEAITSRVGNLTPTLDSQQYTREPGKKIMDKLGRVFPDYTQSVYSALKAIRGAQYEEPILTDYSRAREYMDRGNIDFSESQNAIARMSNAARQNIRNTVRSTPVSQALQANLDATAMSQMSDIRQKEELARAQQSGAYAQMEGAFAQDEAMKQYQNRIDNLQNVAASQRIRDAALAAFQQDRNTIKERESKKAQAALDNTFRMGMLEALSPDFSSDFGELYKKYPNVNWSNPEEVNAFISQIYETKAIKKRKEDKKEDKKEEGK